MLTHLHISDYAIVQKLDLELESGMTVMTGETGAGKSIAIDALGIALGDRADSGAVRFGAKRADISATFDVSNNRQASQWLQENELDDDGECTLRRTVSADGKSRAYINGRPIALQQIRALADILIDIHSQHQHQSLLRVSSQRELLDAYAGTTEKTRQLGALASDWKQVNQLLHDLRAQSAERSKRTDYLHYQLEELQQLAPEKDEWAKLGQKQKRLANVDKIDQVVKQSLFDLYDSDQTLLQQIERLKNNLISIAEHEPSLAPAIELLENTGIQINEAVNELRDVQESLETDPQALQNIDQRMSDLIGLARKHQTEPEALTDIITQIELELTELTGPGASEQDLGNRLANTENEYNILAKDITKARHQGASRLATRVNKFLGQLGMAGARLEVELTPLDQNQFASQGRETISFLLQTNPGQPAKPLAKVASGGELSRVSLAIQVVTAQVAKIPVMVFDEVDVGIGGGVAEVVGQLLRELAAKRQVICITHQAQVAAQGQQHLQVSKQTKGQSTQTSIHELNQQDRTEEIARMIGGIKLTDATREHAKEMLNQANKEAADA